MLIIYRKILKRCNLKMNKYLALSLLNGVLVSFPYGSQCLILLPNTLRKLNWGKVQAVKSEWLKKGMFKFATDVPT